MEDNKKKREKDNIEQLTLALALLLYPRLNEEKIESSADLPFEVQEEVQKRLDSGLDKSVEGIKDIEKDADISDLTKDQLLTVAMTLAGGTSKYYKVVTVGDSKTCGNCAAWEGKIISDDDADYPTFDDLKNSGALHINCRCFLKPVQKANNSQPSEENKVMEDNLTNIEIDKTVDNGETEVQVATIGTIIGSDVEGKPVEQHFTEEALQRIAETTTDEILVDAEHQSEKGGTTEAKGWLSKLKFVAGKGLIGTIKWTDIGRKLVENRVFRWLSPSWLIDKVTREPVLMTSVALTNKPSQIGLIDPIINSLPNQEKITMEITKEELVSLIKDTVLSLNSCAKEDEEVKNEQPVEETKAEETKDNEETIQEAVNEAEEKSEQDVAEEAPAEKPAEPEVAEVVVVEEEEKPEIIKEEVLNSAPVIGADISGKNEWQNLHGKDFWNYMRNRK